MKQPLLRTFWKLILRAVSRLFIRVHITGAENIPPEGQTPLLIVANHFSYFDPMILLTRLPLRARFLAAVEMTKIPFLSHLLEAFEGIPIWRGSVDRTALKTALDTLENNGVVGIFPEGGIMPELQERIARGEVIVDVPNSKSRLSAQLAHPRPGAAYLAANNQRTLVLPIAILGSEQIEGNIRRFPWRRTQVDIYIGKPFGPFELPEDVRGRERRKQIDEYGELMMHQIAQLMPVKHRGPYQRGRQVSAPV